MKNIIILIATVAIIFFGYKKMIQLNKEYKVDLYVCSGESNLFKNYHNYSVGLQKNTVTTIILTDTGVVIKDTKPISGKQAFTLSDYQPSFKKVEIKNEKTSEEGYMGMYAFLPDNPASYVFNPNKVVKIWTTDSTMYIK